jgi:hypothetical protein
MDGGVMTGMNPTVSGYISQPPMTREHESHIEVDKIFAV